MNPFNIIGDFLAKTRSHVYGVFIFWFIIFHIKIVFTGLFVNQDLIYKKTGLLKNEYITQTYLNIHSTEFWIREVIFLILTVLMTYLFIWILPHVLVKRAYRREIIDQTERENIRISEESKLATKEEKLTEQKEKIVEKKEQIVTREQSTEEKQRDQWKRDFTSIITSKRHATIKNFITVLYGDNGYYGGSILTSQELAFIESNNMAVLNRAKNQMSPTEKGKYFIYLYQNTLNGVNKDGN